MYLLMYHEVTNGTPRNVHTVTAGQLRDQLAWLTDNGFRSARLDSAEGNSAESNSAEKQVILTFDDAYVDFIDVALPILKQFNFSATVFVISDLVGKTRHWTDGNDQSEPPLMDWAQIHACRDEGIEIGSHTATHPNLTTLSSPELARELFKSRVALADELGSEIDILCYPYGQQNAEAQAMARKAGYKLACASRPFFVGRTTFDNAFALDRIAMLATDTLDDFAAKINAPLPRRLKWYKWLLKQKIGSR